MSREPQRQLQTQLRRVGRIDSSLFAIGQSGLQSPQKRDG